jgi:hypothetical protein
VEHCKDWNAVSSDYTWSDLPERSRGVILHEIGPPCRQFAGEKGGDSLLVPAPCSQPELPTIGISLD